MTKHILTQEVLKELLHYDPDTGIFVWKRRDRKWFKTDRGYSIWNARYSSNIAGGINTIGYRVIGIFGTTWTAHRLAFLYAEGGMPEKEVDHINGRHGDNRWSNLRVTSHVLNLKNTKLDKRNKSGVMGVWWYERYEAYQVTISKDKGKIHIGYFKDFFEAVCKRKSAELKHDYHENHGRR